MSQEQEMDRKRPARLGDEEFLRVKHEVRQCWRMLGMLHLRMQNDLSVKGRGRIGAAEIEKKLSDVSERLCKMEKGLHQGPET